MKDINNFSNLIEIEGRSFEDLKSKLLKIDSKCAVLHWLVLPTGRYKVIVQIEKPAKPVKKIKDDSLSL